MRGVSSLQPSDFVDFFLNFQTLEVVKFGLMALSDSKTRISNRASRGPN